MATNFFALSSQSVLRNLTQLGTQLALSNERLASAKRINRASDDPSGIVSLTQLNKEIAEIDAASSNGTRIVNMLDTADGALSQISDLLSSIDTQLIAASDSGATAAEKAAAQASIDESIDAINTLANTTSFNGQKLLDGSIGYAASSVDSADLSRVRVHKADLSSGSASVDLAVTAVAEKALLTKTGGPLGSDTTFTLTGIDGSYEFTFTSGSTAADMEPVINAQSGVTGVEAVNNSGTLLLRSVDYGSDQFVSVNVTAGSMSFSGGVTSDYGVDPTVTVNGQNAMTNGFEVTFNSSSLGFKTHLTEAFATATGSTSFTVDAGGTQFQLTGSVHTRINLGIGSVSASNLGNGQEGFLNTLSTGNTNDVDSGNFTQARSIVSAASALVAYERGRLGAVSNYAVTSVTNSLAATKTELSATVSMIEDLDVATETVNNNRLQALMDVNTALLSTLATNQNNLFAMITGKLLQ